MPEENGTQQSIDDGLERRLSEFVVLFLSVLKWVFLASIVGAIVGFSTAVFLLIQPHKMPFVSCMHGL